MYRNPKSQRWHCSKIQKCLAWLCVCSKSVWLLSLHNDELVLESCQYRSALMILHCQCHGRRPAWSIEKQTNVFVFVWDLMQTPESSNTSQNTLFVNHIYMGFVYLEMVSALKTHMSWLSTDGRKSSEHQLIDGKKMANQQGCAKLWKRMIW